MKLRILYGASLILAAAGLAAAAAGTANRITSPMDDASLVPAAASETEPISFRTAQPEVGPATGSAEYGTSAQPANDPYDARFTFVRVRFGSDLGGWGADGRGFGGRSSREPPWAHDYPRAERNLMRIADEISMLRPQADGIVLDLDSPELFRYPFAYICEVGYWRPTEAEAKGLREFLQKGGFLLVDDFRDRDWYNFVCQMERVLPGLRPIEMQVSHPIFRAFFQIDSLDEVIPPYSQHLRPVFYGYFENNDPEARLLAIVNFNNDIGEYWEFADTGVFAVDPSNKAFKLGINYIVYAMTH